MIQASPVRRNAATFPALAALLLSAVFGLAPAPAKADGASDYETLSARSGEVGARYFDAYVGLDWDRLEGLAGEDISFWDPTAERVFGGVRKQGKAEVMQLFREGYAGLSMQFDESRRFASGHYAVFEGELTWTLRLGEREILTQRMPFITTLRIEDGHVVEHRDLADYHGFVEAERSSRPAPGDRADNNAG
jgi:ketosteroid isomerase-like protein